MFVSHITLKGIDQLEKLAYSNDLFYRWTLTHFPADAHALGVLLAWRTFERAPKQVPAYRKFLTAQNFLKDQISCWPILMTATPFWALAHSMKVWPWRLNSRGNRHFLNLVSNRKPMAWSLGMYV